MIEEKETDAQRLTWELKDAVWNEVSHLPMREAFAELDKRSAETVERLGLTHLIRDPRVPRLDKTGNGHS